MFAPLLAGGLVLAKLLNGAAGGGEETTALIEHAALLVRLLDSVELFDINTRRIAGNEARADIVLKRHRLDA